MAYTNLEFEYFNAHSSAVALNNGYDNNGFAKELLAQRQLLIIQEYIYSPKHVSDQRTIPTQLEQVLIEVEKLLKKLKRVNTPAIYAPNVTVMTLDENDTNNHAILDQINQVLGRIRLIYLPEHFGVPLATLQTKNEQEHIHRFPLLSDEHYSHSVEKKLNDFIPLIQHLSGHENRLYKNLGIALISFAAATFITVLYPPLFALIFAIPSSELMKIAVAIIVSLSLATSGVLGFELYRTNIQQGLAKAVNALTQLPTTDDPDEIEITQRLFGQTKPSSPSMFRLPYTKQNNELSLELALKILNKDSSLTFAQKQIDFSIGKKYYYSSKHCAVIDVSSPKIDKDGISIATIESLSATQDLTANHQNAVERLQRAYQKQPTAYNL